ncbi:MAG TPA: TetR family transcriptional regulator, partial [Candidatus Nanopelagicales bacterium]|nr:TetR family transcriptional regulator [Candidatus Nanopelagicales bacterium]
DRVAHDPARGRMKGAADGRPTRTGRRPGSSDTRHRILVAARAAFGELGFEATTIRGVAARAGVDPALVHHYFGTKQRLFVAAMEIPADIAAVIPRALEGPPEELGQRIARSVLELWDSPEMHPLMLGIVRSAATDPVAAAMFRQVLAEGPFLALAQATDRPDAHLRATLVGSQLVGLAMARYIVKVDPIASADREILARAIGPTLRHYLTGDLGGDEPLT